MLTPPEMTLALIIVWIALGLPLVAIVAGWVGLRSRWRFETHHFRALAALLMATAPVALGIGALAYVSFVTPIPPSSFLLERLGLLVSAGGIVAASSSTRCALRWISILTGLISTYMFLFYFLVSSTI